jgi:hypothetical protein
MMCCFIIMVVKGLSMRGLYEYLIRDDPDAQEIRMVIAFPSGKIPNRRTFDRRLFRWRESALAYIASATRWFIIKRLIGIARLVTDRRMFAALGGLWHSKDKKAGRIPKGARNIDKTAGWQKSHYRGWVFGHGLDVIVTIGKLVLPILALGTSLIHHENTVAKALVGMLPPVKKGTLGGDSSYEDDELEVTIRSMGRSLKVATKQGKIPKGKTYQRRKVTVEPFFDRLLQGFPHLRYKLPVKGESRVASYLMTAVFVYQCAVILNVMTKKPPLEVTHFLQFL